MIQLVADETVVVDAASYPAAFLRWIDETRKEPSTPCVCWWVRWEQVNASGPVRSEATHSGLLLLNQNDSTVTFFDRKGRPPTALSRAPRITYRSGFSVPVTAAGISTT